MLMQGNGVAMRIVVTGANGQLGRAVVARLQPHHDVIPLGHADIELCDATSASHIAAWQYGTMNACMNALPSAELLTV